MYRWCIYSCPRHQRALLWEETQQTSLMPGSKLCREQPVEMLRSPSEDKQLLAAGHRASQSLCRSTSPWEGLTLEYHCTNILTTTRISSEGKGEERF